MCIRISFIIIGVALLAFAVGCDVKNEPKGVDRIIYTVDSGAILPELQLHEVYTITRTGVDLVRSGKSSDTHVYEGEWAYTADEGLLTKLFTIAEGGDCTAYKRVEPEEPLDGGETVTIQLVYTDDSDCTLTYDPGTIYEGAEELQGKAREVIENLIARQNVVPE